MAVISYEISIFDTYSSWLIDAEVYITKAGCV